MTGVRYFLASHDFLTIAFAPTSLALVGAIGVFIDTLALVALFAKTTRRDFVPDETPIGVFLADLCVFVLASFGPLSIAVLDALALGRHIAFAGSIFATELAIFYLLAFFAAVVVPVQCIPIALFRVFGLCDSTRIAFSIDALEMVGTRLCQFASDPTVIEPVHVFSFALFGV
jgi:hypothetical protein